LPFFEAEFQRIIATRTAAQQAQINDCVAIYVCKKIVIKHLWKNVPIFVLTGLARLPLAYWAGAYFIPNVGFSTTGLQWS
jgi:hypothetical protein